MDIETTEVVTDNVEVNEKGYETVNIGLSNFVTHEIDFEQDHSYLTLI